MMLSAMVLSCSILVTHAPGWSELLIVNDLWSYSSGMDKALEVVNEDTLHISWDKFNQETRVGYKVIQPDGTVLYPETMISDDVWSINPTGTLVDSDSVAIVWRQGVPGYYCVREQDGEEAISTTLYIPDPCVSYSFIHSSSDSLGRIHSVFEISDETSGRACCYGVFELGVGEIWRDTIPNSFSAPRILVDGNRVHIVFMGEDLWPDYIQYDLDGNVTIPTVSLVEDLTWFVSNFTMALDADRNLYCLFMLSRGWTYISLFKLDGMTGNVLIYDREIWDPLYSARDQTILPAPSGDSLYLLWIESEQDYPRHIKFAIIDQNGDFIEEPYAAYDYSDEELQYLSVLSATTNEDGDIFAIWDQGDVEVGGYWIVMGWFDHNWVGIEEETTTLLEPCEFVLTPSLNPFSESVTITVEADPVPGQLVVYDLSGHMVSTLYGFGSDSFFWDGCDSAGDELPAGTYIIQGASSGRITSVKIVKL